MGDAKVTLLGKTCLAKNTFGFTFKKSFDFIPGQYITIFLGKDSRDFTIASSPLENDFTIVTKMGISDFKNKLFQLPIGSQIAIQYPVGGFTITNAHSEYVFLAGGIGITPFYSMINYFHAKRLSLRMTLFVSFATRDDVILFDELKKIEKNNPKVKIIYTLSQRIDDLFEKGRISESLISTYVPNLTKKKYLIAGSEKMVEDTEELLLEMGVDRKNIRVDIFTGY